MLGEGVGPTAFRSSKSALHILLTKKVTWDGVRNYTSILSLDRLQMVYYIIKIVDLTTIGTACLLRWGVGGGSVGTILANEGR